MKALISIAHSEDNLNEEIKTFLRHVLHLDCVNTISSLLVFPTNLNIWVKAGLSQTLPVLARLEANLVHSWSEGIAGY